MSEAIALGGRRFEIRPLKLGQLRHVLDALEEMAGKSGGALVEAAARVVASGLAPSHPGLTAELVLDLEASLDELNAAVAAILRIAGLRADEPAQGRTPPGEAPPVVGAAAAREPSSPGSTPPSPPAAAMAIARSTG